MHIVQILCFLIWVLLLIVPASGAFLAAGERDVTLPVCAADCFGLIQSSAFVVVKYGVYRMNN